jgi:cytochrome c oxidase cbb3-type subunit 3
MSLGARAITVGLTALVLVAAAVAAVSALRQSRDRNALLRADPETILAQPRLAEIALSIGKAGFTAHCAACHGAAGRGDRLRNAPDLASPTPLYGVGIAKTEQIILHGIRSGDSKGWNLAIMPAYASPKPDPAQQIAPLGPADIRDVTAFVASLAAPQGDAAAVGRGAALFTGRGGCYDCHGDDGAGDEAIGAPGLGRHDWLYGDGSSEAIARSIANGHAGLCPAFARLLTPLEARAIAVYVGSLRLSGLEGAGR